MRESWQKLLIRPAAAAGVLLRHGAPAGLSLLASMHEQGIDNKLAQARQRGLAATHLLLQSIAQRVRQVGAGQYA
jgi:hypothetical protein